MENFTAETTFEEYLGMLGIANFDELPEEEQAKLVQDYQDALSGLVKQYEEENKKKIQGMDTKASLILNQYSWPGNVRELRNCIESAVVMCKGALITEDDLPPYLRATTEKDMIRLNTGISLQEAEKQIITFTLNQNGGNKSKTAEILGIGRKTLHRKLNEYKIES